MEPNNDPTADTCCARSVRRRLHGWWRRRACTFHATWSVPTRPEWTEPGIAPVVATWKPETETSLDFANWSLAPKTSLATLGTETSLDPEIETSLAPKLETFASEHLCVDACARRDLTKNVKMMSNANLRSVRIYGRTWLEYYIDPLLVAIANNSSIQRLVYESPPASFAAIHQVMTTLTELVLHNQYSIYFDDQWDGWFAAFRGNTTLVKLRISRCGDCIVTAVLSGLDAQSNLQELELSHMARIEGAAWASLCRFLPIAQHLRHLILQALYSIDTNELQTLAKCLNDRDESCFLTKVTLTNCYIGTTLHFLEFAMIANDGGTSLRELSLGQVGMNICVHTLDRLTHTVDMGRDSLRLLKLSLRVCLTSRFIQSFIEDARDMRLECLRLYETTHLEDDVMARFLARMPCLKRLHLPRRQDPIVCVRRILREHTNIHVVTIFDVDTDDVGRERVLVVANEQTPLVQAYCQRNQHLVSLLHARSAVNTREDDLILVPSLLQASLQIRKVETIFSSVTSLRHIIGPIMSGE